MSPLAKPGVMLGVPDSQEKCIYGVLQVYKIKLYISFSWGWRILFYEVFSPIFLSLNFWGQSYISFHFISSHWEQGEKRQLLTCCFQNMSGCWIPSLAGYRIVCFTCLEGDAVASRGSAPSVKPIRPYVGLLYQMPCSSGLKLSSCLPGAPRARTTKTEVHTWRNLFTVHAGRMRYSGFRKPISCVNTYIYVCMYVDRNLKKRPAAAVGEGSLGNSFQWPCLSPSQTFMLIYCMHLCSLYQCSIWIGADTCLRINKGKPYALC